MATLQDSGRFGSRHIGVGSGGAMDLFALLAANYLCNNDGEEAVLELNFPAPEFIFEENAIIALAGADFAAMINETPLPPWRTIAVKKGSILSFRRPVSGSKAYLAVRGGWQAEKWLESYSTHLKLGKGGFGGKAIQKNDSIGFLSSSNSLAIGKIMPWQVSNRELAKVYGHADQIQCIAGKEYELLTATSKNDFNGQFFTLSQQSDRMGYRLSGQPLMLQQHVDLVSSAVDRGTVQLLPSGSCIVLMADHQTIGGYPRIASVARVDLPKLAQLQPGQAFGFTIISPQEAENQLVKRQKLLSEIKWACTINFKKHNLC